MLWIGLLPYHPMVSSRLRPQSLCVSDNQLDTALRRFISHEVTRAKSLWHYTNVIKLSSWVTSFQGGVTQIFVFAYFVKSFGC